MKEKIQAYLDHLSPYLFLLFYPVIIEGNGEYELIVRGQGVDVLFIFITLQPSRMLGM